MKKLRRRVSAALHLGSGGHGNVGVGGGHLSSGGMSNGHSLAESMSELAVRIAAVGELREENNGDPPAIFIPHHRAMNRAAGEFHFPSQFIPDRPDPLFLASHHNKSPTHQQYIRNKGRTSSWHSTRLHPACALPSAAFFGGSAAVVHESNGLGSDGESMDASPCTSEQNGSTGENGRYVVNVKMRQKPNRRWSEQDIQKRLSLPADLRLPLSVVEKLNRTPTLDQPLTRKSRRASLSEIGFGKLETYEKLEKLGEGTYATVYRGRSLLTEKFVALKEIRLEQEEGAPCTAIREVSLLRDLRHANVVTLHDIIHTDRLLTLVFEYVDRDLKQYMDDCNNCIALHNVQLFLLQLLRGLAYCHQRRVLHRDLKPQNLLINEKGELKLADFGLARAKSVPTKTYSHEVVTLWYRPPDVLLGCTDYTTSIDMWGVGCILFEMVAGRALFPGSSTDEQIHLIFRTLGTPRPERHPNICASAQFRQYAFPHYVIEPLVNQAPRLDANGLDLLSHLLQFEGRSRMSARDALRHAFLRSQLPPAIFELGDQDSVMSVPGVRLIRDASSSLQQLSRSRRSRERRSYLL